MLSVALNAQALIEHLNLKWAILDHNKLHKVHQGLHQKFAALKSRQEPNLNVVRAARLHTKRFCPHPRCRRPRYTFVAPCHVPSASLSKRQSK